MSLVPVHVGGNADQALPLSPDNALVIMAVGLLVLAVVAYDAYRAYEARQRERT